jgi:hypothetical protein
MKNKETRYIIACPIATFRKAYCLKKLALSAQNGKK